ncbi:MAG: NAD(P)/FAD-dependent oxidoreductase [Clostridia bacterium]|nr:NAD(P)/FAD-dependent oxidoreductase [Clostridia bacterium]
MFDIAIIGAGAIGTAIARVLSKYQLNTIILEKDNDVSGGTTKANSAIIHAGYDAPYDSNKGIFNVKGNAMFDEWCKDLDVPFKRIGSLVVAHNDEELETLKELKENGDRLGVPNLEIISGDKVKAMEPNLREDIIAALYAPSAGIIEPWELAIACAENAIENGVELRLNYDVKAIEQHEDHFRIFSDVEDVEAKLIINAAGVYADQLYKMVNENPEFSIHPRRGQYYLLDKEVGTFVNHVIFPTPTKLGKGTLVTPTVDGNILVGPDSEDLEECKKESVNTTYDRLAKVKELAIGITDKVPYGMNITTFAGLRAEPSTGDFIIEESSVVPGFINVAGIKSPGLSSAPAIAVYVGELVGTIMAGLVEKADYNPVRRPKLKFEHLSAEEKAALIKENPAYGRIICRCEMITEGEIVDAIHRSAGGRTVNGIKRRVRPGAGRCQGGFCGPRVMEILARELKCDMEDVLQENKGSYVLSGHTKA